MYEAELREAGMNPAQFELLATVRGKPGSSQAELAAAMDADQTTLSRNLKLLSGQGWISSAISTKDRRRTEYALSTEGMHALEAAMPCWERARARMDEGLGRNAADVWAVLDGLSAAAQHHPSTIATASAC
jgi:DNA-binding MarR family transcriptional regulator